MVPRQTSRTSVLLGIGLAGIFLLLAFHGVDWYKMLQAARHGHAEYLALAFVTLTAAFFLRSLRWRVLLSAEQPVAPLPVFWATATGYLGNYLLPARAGELIRSLLIARRTALSTGYTLATALTERMLDAVTLALIGAAAPLAITGLPSWVTRGAEIIAVLGIAAVLSLGIASRAEYQLRRILARLPLPERLGIRIGCLLQEFLLGLRALQEWKRAARFAALTVVIWLTDATETMLVARSLDLHVTLPQALLLLVALGLASAAPSTPGYIGIFQFVFVTILMPLGYGRDQALALSIVYQLVTYSAVLTWGLLGMWQLSAAEPTGTRLVRQHVARTVRGALWKSEGEDVRE